MNHKSGQTEKIFRNVSMVMIAVLVAVNFLVSFRMGSGDIIHGGATDAAHDAAPLVSDADKGDDTPSEGEEKPPGVSEVSRARISMTGDVIGHTALLKTAYLSKNKYNFDFIYTHLKRYVSSSDYAVTNLETTLGGSNYGGYPAFNSPDSLVDAIIGAGFDMLLTANNHANDTSYKGMLRTAQVLNKKGIDFIGTVEHEEDKRYIVREVNGIKIGMICYTYEGRARDSKGYKYLNGIMEKRTARLINTFNVRNLDEFYKEFGERMDAMKAEGAQVIVAYMHWGKEYALEPNGDQRNMAQKLCDMGVDVIVGGHPHVVQPMQLLTGTTDSTHRTVCIYSVGNSVSNQRKEIMKLKTGHTEDGVYFSFTLSQYSNGRVIVSDVDVLPTWVNVYRNKKTGRDVYEIIPLDKSAADWKKAFSLSDKSAEDAEKSYDRTMKIVGAGLEACRKSCRAAADAIVSGSDLS